MTWKLRNSKVLDDLYLSQLEKHNPELIYRVDDIVSGLKKLNASLPTQNIVIMRSNNSNKGFVCFNGHNCKDLENQFENIIRNYKERYNRAHNILDSYK
jgi:hypothetical protein